MTSLSYQQALKLVEGYFNATTTETEERLLKDFLLTAAADAPEFDEVRAVLSYAAVARHSATSSSPSSSRLRQLRNIAAAAVVALAVGGIWHYQWHEPTCIAYVDGVRITDRQQVEKEMENTLRNVLSHDADAPTVEGQLRDIFSIDNYSTTEN